jgi:hypothetical protein
MINGKFFSILVGIIIVILAIWNSSLDANSNVLENFINVPMTTVRMPIAQLQNGNTVALKNDFNAMMATNGKVTATLGPNVLVDNNKMYMTPPSFQSILAPRFSNTGYGAYINYNLPDEKNLGVPNNPLNLSNMVSEGYCSDGGCGSVQNCRVGGISSNNDLNKKVQMSQMGAGNNLEFNPSYENAKANLNFSDSVVDMLPLSDMSIINSTGDNDANPVMYERFVFANQRSRLASRGDFIRGDLPITPCSNGWFNVSVNPNIDLNTGAMAVLGGLNNETAQETYALTMMSSGGSKTTSGGVNLNETIDVSAQKMGYAGDSTNELQFTAFP